MANENLVIANFNTAGKPFVRWIGSASGTKIQQSVGPQSFAAVTEAQVGPLPWTVAPAPENPKPLFKSNRYLQLLPMVKFRNFGGSARPWLSDSRHLPQA